MKLYQSDVSAKPGTGYFAGGTHQSKKDLVRKEEKALVLKTVKPPARAVIRMSTARYLSPMRVCDSVMRNLQESLKEKSTSALASETTLAQLQGTHAMSPSDILEYTMKAGCAMACRNSLGESCRTVARSASASVNLDSWQPHTLVLASTA